MSPSSGNAGIDREEAVPASAAPRPSSAPALEALSSLESILSESTIAIFSKSSCCACVRVKQLFEKTGASFKIIELNQRADGPMLLEALMDWTKQRTVPYVFINGKHIGGCDGDLYELENALKEWIGQRLAADNELENVLKEWSGQMLAGDNVMNEKHIAPVPINWNKNNTKWFYDICLELIATGDMEVGKLSEEVCDVICKRLLKKGIECDEHQIRNKWEASKRLHSFWHKQVASVKDAKKDDKWWKKVLKARIALTEYRELKEDPSKKIETLDMIFGCSKIEKVVQNFQSPPEDATSLQRELEFVTEDRDYLKKQLIEVQAVHENNLDDLQRKISFLSDKLKQCENEIKDLKKLVDVKDSEIHEGEELRKKMNEMILELKGNMRVFVRIRPAKDSEEDHITYPQSFELKGRGIEVKEIGQVKQYVYDKVFGPDTNQKQIFDELSDLVESSLDGHKVCIFAYGQTGSGKTHTMIGGSCNDSVGLIPRSLKQIFERIDSKQNWTYTVHVSAAEIYLKDLYDLLARGKCKIPDFNLIEIMVSDTASSIAILEEALCKRSVRETKMNAYSSRSHFVFRVWISGFDEKIGQSVNGFLVFIDLGGSERAPKSSAEGVSLQEAAAINSSLLMLTQTLYAIAKGEKPTFRNTKLTHLLEPYLTGGPKTLMLVNISPDASSISETTHALQFAESTQVRKGKNGQPGGHYSTFLSPNKIVSQHIPEAQQKNKQFSVTSKVARQERYQPISSSVRRSRNI